MSIPTTLTIYVPEGADSQSNALRAGLRAVLAAVYVGRQEDFPPDHDGRAFSDEVRAFYHEHPGLLDVVTHGGTAVFRARTKRGDHEFRVHVPEGMDYDHHCDADGENNAELQLRRGGRWERRPSDNDESLLVHPHRIQQALTRCATEASLRDELARLCALPPPTYSVGTRRYEEAWE